MLMPGDCPGRSNAMQAGVTIRVFGENNKVLDDVIDRRLSGMM